MTGRRLHTPMTSGHLFFATVLTAQILISIPYEKQDMEGSLGESYKDYKRRVPMLELFLKSKK